MKSLVRYGKFNFSKTEFGEDLSPKLSLARGGGSKFQVNTNHIISEKDGLVDCHLTSKNINLKKCLEIVKFLFLEVKHLVKRTK